MRENDTKQQEKAITKPIKDYLYLNMDFLEAAIAQIDGGYKALQISDDTREAKDIIGSRTNTLETEINGKLNKIIARLVDLEGAVKATTQSAPTYNIDTQLSKDVIVMKQRENILDRFIDYLGFKDLDCFVDKVCDHDIGNYVALYTYFDYFNFSRLDTLTSKEMLDFYKGKNDKDSLPLENIEQINAKLPLLRKLFPFDTFLYANGIIVLINDDYLRDGKEQAGYKFNSKVKVIGMVNKLASEPRTNSVPASVTMDKIQITTLALLRELGFAHENDTSIYLVTPIAIYV